MRWSRRFRLRPLNRTKGSIGRYRWLICGLLFAATAINYVDRQIIGVLKPTLQLEFGWTEGAFADVIFWFQAAYALGYIGFGKLVDKLGARAGYAACMVLWTIAHVAHACVASIAGFAAVRFALGLGESGNFPAGLKAIAEWFPQRERAFATGIFNAGSNVGAILMSPDELAFINSDPPAADPRMSWRQLLRIRETWAYAAARFMIDPVWWMFLFWLPDFFAKRYGLDLKNFGPPLVVVYAVSDIGSIAGGWLSSKLIRIGVSVNRARKMTMFLASLLVLPVMFAMYADNLWLAVAIVGAATAGHQAFSANLYTFPSDVFPKRAVASVVGIGGTAGAIGGMLMAKYAGWVLDGIGGYTPIFMVAGTVYWLALATVQLLSPRMEAVRTQ